MRRPFILMIPALLVAAACSGDDSDGGATTAAPTISVEDSTTTTAPAPRTEALVCDPLDERACLLPWPNDAFTVPDPETVTGRRLAIDAGSTPKNAKGIPIDVTDQNRADGFSPGSAVLAFVPGLDIEKSRIAPSTDIGASLDPESPVVLLDTDTGTRLAHWAELDAQAPEGDRVLMVRPAVALPEGHRIVVVLRNLLDADGNAIPASEAFRATLDNTTEPPERGSDFVRILDDIAADGIDANEVYLAWDFTVASAESLSGRALAMRETAYATLGDAAPGFTVSDQLDSATTRVINGTYEVPNFLTGDGAPGSTLLLDADGTPILNDQQPTYTAPFRCVLPLSGNTTTIIFGHGLLGNLGQVDGLSFAADMGLAGVCGTDEIGMATEDLPNVAKILDDLSHFPEQADRMVQGILNQQILGRLLNHPQGFASSPAFQNAEGTPLVANDRTVFVGNSQGGILGGAASALSNEWTNVVLGVPGINYSLLLTRSSDWPEFQAIFDTAYTDPVDRVLALQLSQLLWDRGENNGYAQHLTDDIYPGTDEAKKVLLVQAFGDHQVANVSTEVLARTIGAAVHEPALAPGRSADVDPQWGIPALDHSAQGNAAVVVWDFGTPHPPTVNLPPTDPEYGRDPHGAGSDEPLVLQQALTFLLTGEVPDVCDGKPCVSTALQG
ncbi:MAG: hypothetical protein ACKPDI_00520 [Actinomycetota bacterium]